MSIDREMEGINSEDYKVGPGNPPKETQWKPGQSGNPKGRPKGIKYVSELLTERLNEVPDTVDGKSNTKTWRELVTDSIFQAILRGNHPGFLKELLDRTEGKVTQPIGGGEGREVKIRVVYGDGD